MKDDA